MSSLPTSISYTSKQDLAREKKSKKIQIADSAYPLIILIDGFKKKRWFFIPVTAKNASMFQSICVCQKVWHDLVAPPHAAKKKTLSILHQNTKHSSEKQISKPILQHTVL